MAFEHAIVLTGGIATGKSTVAKIFAAQGFEIIDADRIAHRVLDEQQERVTAIFGCGFVKEGKVDRKALGAVVFADKEKRRALEALLHPLIYREIEKEAQKLDALGKPYLVDIPLFFETNRYPISRSLVVYTTKAQQLKRLMQRDGYNTQNAQQRIDAQLPIDEKRDKATYVIDNTGDLAHLKAECERVMRSVKQTTPACRL
ncbi:dephospho-CoA kinase [Sulfurovum sp.]|jgi:dephospho-CoA kinase|uniref:dephospho-CoA kinase n=1 Tax=Sulfurovum sp. TaxID=1969726 RepID=UPI002A371A2C|nr:dephospho-CoA kinase [Sulfurovum sp.]MDD2450634.1 dephospho-CoA kinase [Sulfurovum sp.]MDY0402797.1 dephospho-CoA kinase [Sulfurovum sp.]